MLRRGFSTQRRISTSGTRLWDEIRVQTHAGEHVNPHLSHPSTVSVIGAPMTYGQPFLGTDHGPHMLREHGLHQRITELNWQVEELGDLEFQAPQSTDPVIDPALGKAKQSFAGLY